MKYDPQKHPFDTAQGRHRRSIRLPDYDYSEPGAYFITMVTRGRECLFGGIEHGELQLNNAGQIVLEVWNSLPDRYPQIGPGTAQVIPNHFHGIVNILSIPVGAIHELPQRESPQQRERRRMTLPLVVGYFKMNTAKRINQILGSEGISDRLPDELGNIWQGEKLSIAERAKIVEKLTRLCERQRQRH